LDRRAASGARRGYFEAGSVPAIRPALGYAAKDPDAWIAAGLSSCGEGGSADDRAVAAEVGGVDREGGLRCPSEILRLRWEDILWDKDRFWVHASKTEHHEDGGLRQVPLFPELQELMLEAFEEAQPGEEYIIASYRGGETNLRTQLTKIIKRAGHEPWPKLFQNLRSTRETELIRDHGIAAACEWVGNTPLVALKHYAQVTEEDVQRAAGKACQTKENDAVQNPVHNPVQTAFSCDCQTLPEKPRQSASQAVGKSWQKKTPICKSRQGQSMGHTGLEPVTSRV